MISNRHWKLSGLCYQKWVYMDRLNLYLPLHYSRALGLRWFILLPVQLQLGEDALWIRRRALQTQSPAVCSYGSFPTAGYCCSGSLNLIYIKNFMYLATLLSAVLPPWNVKAPLFYPLANACLIINYLLSDA